RRNHHPRRCEAAARQGGTDIAKIVDLVCQPLEVTPAHAELVLDGEHTGRRDHQVGLDAPGLAHEFQQALRVDGARCAGYTDDQAPLLAHSFAPASFSAACSSPMASISPMMSEPPMNSPWMYS